MQAEPVWDRLMKESQLSAREAGIAEFNAAHRHRKRGYAAIPCKFGVCYEPTFLNQVRTVDSTAKGQEAYFPSDGRLLRWCKCCWMAACNCFTVELRWYVCMFWQL